MGLNGRREVFTFELEGTKKHEKAVALQFTPSLFFPGQKPIV